MQGKARVGKARALFIGIVLLGAKLPASALDFPALRSLCQMNSSARSVFLNSSKLSLTKAGEFKIQGIVYSDPATVDYMASFGFTIQGEDELQPKKRKLFHLIMGAGSFALMGATLSADQPRNIGSDHLNMALVACLIAPAIYGTLMYAMPFDHRRYLAARFNQHLERLKKPQCS